MPYSFYLFDTATWTETTPGAFFETTSGSERLIGDTTGRAGDTITFNGYDGAQLVGISGSSLSDSTASGSLTAPVTINGATYGPTSGSVELDLGFVLRDPATGTYYFVGYVTINNIPVGSVVSQGWNPASPDEWQEQGPSAGTTLVLTNVTTTSPPNNPFLNNTSLGPRFSSSVFSPFSNDVVLTSGITGIIDTPSEVICFAAGTLIATETGERPVETLAIGDRVLTADHGLQPLRWRGQIALGPAALQKRPALAPIRIAAGALGPGKPHSDLLLSPQHRVLIRSRIVQRLFGVASALAAVKHLTDAGGIAPAGPAGGVVYVHLMFDRHEIVLANGAETESLFLGPEARKSLEANHSLEALELFPELDPDHPAMAPARKLLSGRIARRLSLRHRKNGVSLNAEPPARAAPARPRLQHA
ncbi:Hint domain-containing protein [Frigidibacter mobilis]|uniref:Hemolysin-type calcium-binding region n=1 Tax=Frigidibacter mobilis TaxID=1335048 RepID=A0A159Z2U4_9RHOB|nr:Hint domain-containing protein [Frigidibacter mobilis]AMY68478.1 hemolysin-type calcium-binding region [Frigidibacter mobilis]